MFFWGKFSQDTCHIIIFAPLELPVLSIPKKDWYDMIISRQWGFQTTINRYIEKRIKENV